jgi:GR25 family glycosyltransferase involved in LPS biosynthesis
MTRILVTAIRSRTPFVEYLQSHIPNLEVVWDTTHNAMDTFLTACLATGNDPVIRLEDDICLTKNFVQKIEKVIAERPNEVIHFFSRSKDDLLIGSRYKSGGSFSMNQCVYYPYGLAPKLAAFYSDWERKKEHPTGYDLLMADYFRKEKMKYWVHIPSLVEHAEVVSEIDHRRSSKRQSKTFSNPEFQNYPLTK